MRIRKISFSNSTLVKLQLKHNISSVDIQLALDSYDLEQSGWDISTKHGGRYVIKADLDDGLELLIVLAPIDLDIGEWKCITAFVPRRRKHWK